MAKFLSEDEAEQALLETFRKLGYETAYGPEIAPGGERPERAGYGEVVLAGRLRAALARNNPRLPAEALEDAFRKVTRAEAPGLVPGNRAFHKQLVEGIDVEVPDPGRAGGVAHDKAWIFHEDPVQNDFLVVNQHVYREDNRTVRFDAVVFVNGLPLAVFEFKAAGSEQVAVRDAFDDFQIYKERTPGFFLYNEVLVASDGFAARAGTLTSDWDRFAAWRSIDGTVFDPLGIPQQEVLVRGMFDRVRLIDLLRWYVVFADDGQTLSKKLASYHQYFAVEEAVRQTLAARWPRGDRRIGVFWHTQGSGKSLSMVFYAAKVARRKEMENPTLVVITDRNDLDDQLFGTFAACSEILRQTPEQARDRDHLRDLLDVASGGIVFTTIHKFLPEKKGERPQAFCPRSNVLVLADEAHRSQYDFVDGLARNLRDALPRASFIGFTGTPIEIGDKSTPAVFGGYIQPTYDVERSIEDGVTVPIHYEARLARIDLKDEARPRIDPEFEEVTETEEDEAKERLKTKWARLEAMVGAEERVKQVARDVVEHFERREAALAGKGMVVAMSRRICVLLHDEIVALRPEWYAADDEHGVIKVVMTGSGNPKKPDPEEWKPHVRGKEGRRTIERRFKDPDDPLKLVLVRDMWLTGFDVPPLHTQYLGSSGSSVGESRAI